MKLPQLRKKPELKSCHNVTWEDNYSWIHQKNILEVLKDKKKLNPEVENYLNQENKYTDHHLKDTKIICFQIFFLFIPIPYFLNTMRTNFFSKLNRIISFSSSFGPVIVSMVFIR